jgi:hypothetical protein
MRSLLGSLLLTGLIISAAAMMMPHKQAAQPAICAATPVDIVPDDDMPSGRGAPLEWYQKNWGAPAGNLGPVAACFAKGTDPAVMEFVNQAIQSDPMQRYQLAGRWSGTQGTPRALTWSFAPDGLSIPGGIGEATSNNILFNTLDTKFAALGGRAYWVNRVQQCFDRWQQLTGITYTRITVGGNDWDDGAVWGSAGAAGARGDIRISMHLIDGINGVLAYNQFPSNGDMVLDSGESWQQGSAASNQHRFFRNTIMHEHGHGIGMQHCCPVNATKLMEPFLATSFDGPRHDDIRGAQRHYGDVNGSNNTSGTAANLGTPTDDVVVTYGSVPLPVTNSVVSNSSLYSIDGNGEVDYFKFSVAGSRTVTVTVQPQGLTYDSSSQSCGGSDGCCSGNNINSLAQANLNLDVLATDGSTILGSAASQPSGSPETVAGIALPAAGTYYIRVLEGDTPSQSQLYTLDVLAANTAPCSPPTVSGLSNANTPCGVAYTSPAPTAGPGTPPITWTLSGSPPAGMTIDAGTGVVSWPTPLTTGSPYTVTVVATNSCGSDSESYQLTVDANPPSVTPIPDTAAVCGSLWTSAAPSASGGVTPYTWSLVGVPPAGMTINPATGVVSWPNPIVAGAPYGIMVQASSASGCGGGVAFFQLTVRLGDFNGDGVVSALDIPSFIDHLLGLTATANCAADMNGDGLINGDDAQLFVDAL